MSRLLLELYQFEPAFGDAPLNARRIAERAARSTAALLVTPELSLTGYDLGDEATHLSVKVTTGEPLTGMPELRAAPGLVTVGLPERGRDAITYNSLVVLDRGVVRFRYRKVYLPTYGMFDEARFFGRGRIVEPFQLADWRVGFLVCEDFWHPGLVYALAAGGIDLLVVAAAAPGRGGVDADTGGFSSMASWERITRTTAQLYGIWVALANRCGVEGGVTFAGGSLIVGPDGEPVARAPAFEEASLTVELTRDALERARRPFAHLRDEDPGLMRTLLERIDG